MAKIILDVLKKIKVLVFMENVPELQECLNLVRTYKLTLQKMVNRFSMIIQTPAFLGIMIFGFVLQTRIVI